MKRQLLILSFVLGFWFGGRAQWVSIPDSNFGNWLNIAGYSPCLQGNGTIGWQMDTTCNAVVTATSMNCSQLWSIHDLSGIQYFDSLRNLDCSENGISNIPALPKSLLWFDCSTNNLNNLPPLPDSLIQLTCNLAGLVALPGLPNTLQYLFCARNNLSSIPPFPNFLRTLDCSSNLFTNLPPFPNSLKTISCYNNQLTELPSLPDSLLLLECGGNHALYCLPEFKWIQDLNFDVTSITCLPNYGNVLNSSPVLSSLPLCDIFNLNGCSVYWNISGKVYQDMNVNCINDLNEKNLSNIPINLYENGILQQQTNTISGGDYTFNTGLSTYQYSIDTSYLPFTMVCPDSGFFTSLITPMDSFDFSRNFGLQCKLGFDLVAQSIVGRFRIGSTRKLDVSAGDYTNFFYSASCATGLSGSVQLTMSGPVTYFSPASGALNPTNVSNDSITWSVADFGAINFFTDFNIMVQTDTNAQIGSLVCFSLVVSPFSGDNYIPNNALDYCGVVVASIDPNEKEVSPIGNVHSGDRLTYTIHFQNTGTAEAQHIYIDDTLDARLDASTFQLLAYSHQPLTQVFNLENRVRFNFPNINLPDSNANEAASHGYVQYRIKTKPNLNCGTQVGNPAYIYFDFNLPVVTNAALNTVRYTNSTNLQMNICTGEQYDFNGVALSTAGDYTDTLQTANVCDSIINLHLNVLSGQTITIDTVITQGSSYTLPSGNVVSSAGTYTDTLVGSNHCDSVVVTNLDVVSAVEEFGIQNFEFRIFPNPANEILNVEVDKSLLGSTLTIYDVTGKKIMAVQLSAINIHYQL